MKTEKLFELLALVNGVKIRRWNTVMKIVDYIDKGTVDIKEKKWDNLYKESNPQYYPLDLSKIDTWSTFEDTCVELIFHVDLIKLICDVKIYDGESFGGHRKKLRFTATLWMPNAFIHEIENNVNWAFETYLEDAYENHLEAKKKLWIDNLKNEILNKE